MRRKKRCLCHRFLSFRKDKQSGPPAPLPKALGARALFISTTFSLLVSRGDHYLSNATLSFILGPGFELLNLNLRSVGIGYCHIVRHVRLNLTRAIALTPIVLGHGLALAVSAKNSAIVVNTNRFACSRPRQFKWLEEHSLLFKAVQEKVTSGQFHLISGTWVENDGNMPSSEALVRQFVYSQRYFEAKLGKKCDTPWLPDSFGLTAACPHLIRDAGIKHSPPKN
ncbi:glycosyl hydrolases family 38 N-terminal domain-containing protein [Hygrophoropsis aurantiaca]|uniref:Glycosyl hydrolases family 38 N-terminal domain-containing protein n=1 Tax=Hygrophoropsis aurantiaca TaxID=72124 RepID=A0ACB7ZVA5_9AGAM|nr:glycosyl hydrolases family 38 N-terminal domain-containing protein [Hygrophoropsis aurantiaca]